MRKESEPAIGDGKRWLAKGRGEVEGGNVGAGGFGKRQAKRGSGFEQWLGRLQEK